VSPLSPHPSWTTLESLHDVQSALLRSMVDRCLLDHPRYRSLLAGQGIRAGDVTTLADLARLPLTTKADFVADPEGYRLEVDPDRWEHVLADVMYTAGTTTGRPTPIYSTAHDQRAILFAQLRMAAIRGLTRRDRIANLYPLAPVPHGGWNRPTQAAAALGAPVVVGMGGVQDERFPVTRRLDGVLDVLADFDPSVLWGVPSYLDRLLRRAAERGLRLPSVRMMAVSGEPCGPTQRRGLLALSGAVGALDAVVSDSLGASELQFSLVECPDGGGFHNPAPELAHVAVLDDHGLQVPDGEPGRLAYTHLDRAGTVLLRFLVGDRAVLDSSPCPGCGWLGGRVVTHLGRDDAFTKVRGNLLSIPALHEAIAGVDGVVDHRVVIAGGDGRMDTMAVQVAVTPGRATGGTAAAVALAVRGTVGVRPEVTLVDLNQIFSAEDRLKPRRFIDQRHSEPNAKEPTNG